MGAGIGDIRAKVGAVGGKAFAGRAEDRRYSLQASLVALVAVCVLPAALIAAGLVYANYGLERDRIHRDTVLTARHLLSELDRELAAVESGMRVLAGSPDLAAGDLASFHERAREALKGQIVKNYLLTDREERQHLNTLVPFGTALPTTGTPAQLLRVFESGTPVITDLFIGPVSRLPVVAMGVPVYRGSHIEYSLNIGLAPERIGVILERHPLPEGWVAAVLDSSGTIVARTREAQRFVGQKAVGAVVEQLSQGSEGTRETVTMEGVPAVSSFSRSSLYGWSVAVGAPKAALEEDLYRMIACVGAGLAFVVAGGLWLATRLAGRVTAAVRGLNDAALALGSGRPVEMPKTRLIEADAVGTAIVEAARILEQTRYLAHHDALTGLCNRILFDEMLQRHLAAAERSKGSLAVLAVDLDDFKTVNDEHGHAAGDLILRAVAERIRETIRASDVAARMGGDEFAVLLGEADATAARQLAERLVAALSAPYEGRLPRTSASVGIAVHPRAGADGATLLERADRALYDAKRLGKQRVVMEP